MVANRQEEVPFAPELTDEEQEKSKKVETTPVPVIHEVIRKGGEMWGGPGDDTGARWVG